MRLTAGYVICFLIAAVHALAQTGSNDVLKQERNGVEAKKLTSEERSSLGDPFFNLVLKNHADVTDLTEIERLIQPDTSKRQTFVVHERITDATPGQQRRAVITFLGANQNEVLHGNVMLSVFFESQGFRDSSEIEALGWDGKRGRYNYYKLDRSGTENQRLLWKFRGSSDGTDMLTAAQREGTCMACHINGAPIMKELAEPWNNWHSPRSPAFYLLPSATVDQRWPVAMDDRFRNERLRVAEELEITILSSISQFNKHRIDRALAATTRGKPKIVNGMMTVIDGRRLLRPLFVTTEFNLVSSFQKSGLYPFPMLNRMGPDQDISVPNSFFLNASLVSGQNISVPQGLGLTKANEFSRIVRVKSEEYTALVNKFKIGLGGCVPGDADFAWFVPEPSHIDNDLIERLMRRGIVTPEFVAAVVSIDLETPILSNDRASLLKFVPTNFPFQPMPIEGTPLSVKRHPDLLTKQVISTIEQSRPVPESAAAKFMQMLKSRNPLQILQQKIDGYLQNVQTQLQQDRPAAVERLFRIAVERRTAVLDHDVLRRLDETIGENGTMHSRLFPLPEAAPVDCP